MILEQTVESGLLLEIREWSGLAGSVGGGGKRSRKQEIGCHLWDVLSPRMSPPALVCG